MLKTLVTLAGVVLIGTAFGFAAGAREEAENGKEGDRDDAHAVAIDKLPKAARKALTQLAGKAKIEELTVEDEDGVKVYEGSWEVDGVEHEAEVTENGDVVETEEGIGWDAVPKAVQQAASKAFPKGTKVSVEKKTVVLYEVEADIDGKEKEVLIAPTGERIEIEDEEDND